MNPTAAAIVRFQSSLRAFRATDGARVLHVRTASDDLSALEQTLRAEEWQPDNRAPFLLFAHSYETGGECLLAMASQLREHYGRVREGVAKEGAQLEEFGPIDWSESRFARLVTGIRRFTECSAGILHPPLVCWLLPQVRDVIQFRIVVVQLLRQTPDSVRFVLVDDDAASVLGTSLADAGIAAMPATFAIDQAAMKQWFAALMLATPRKGRAPGAPPGAAAPDVTPPPRPGPQPATEEQIKATRVEHGLPPMLTATEGDQVRRLVFAAADALAAGNRELACQQQYDAYELCARAGVKLEQGVMALVLAGYLVQAQQDEEALQWFQEAAALTRRVGATPQLSQSLMGAGYVLFKARRFGEAAAVYRDAATAASEAKLLLLQLENLRMAGVCFQQLSRFDDMIAFWLEAIRASEHASPGEIAASCFHMIADDLCRELRQRSRRDELAYVAGVQNRFPTRAEQAEAV